MKRTILILLLSLICGKGLHAQFDSSFAKKNILRCADSLSKGFLTRDWELFSRYSYPALIGTLGGKQEFIRQVKERLSLVPDTAWKRYEPGRVLQVIQTGADLQAVVELFSVIEWQGRRISTVHHLIAESWNGGNHWTFFDSQNDRNIASTIKPDLSPQLIIPAKNEKMESLDN